MAENASNLNITGGEFYTTGPRTSVGNESYNTLVNDLSWTIEGAYLQILLTFKTFNTSSSEFSPQNAVVNFEPSTKTWSVWGMQQSGGGMIGGMDWVEIGNIGTLSSIDNGDGTWQVIYEFEYNVPSSYSWFEVRSSDGDTLQITTELIEFSVSATSVNYDGDVNQLNFVLQDQGYGETLLSGTLNSTETSTGIYDLVYTFSAPSIVNIANPSITIFENYGGENQVSVQSGLIPTVVQSGPNPPSQPVTFITSKLVGEVVFLNVNSSTGYWKYSHNNTFSSVYSDNSQSAEVLNANGEFTIISCLSDGTESGDITSLWLNDNQLTSFDGTGLSSLTNLVLQSNQLTSLDEFTFPTSLSYLNLGFNQLTSFVGTGLSNLTDLNLDSNQLTSFVGTGLSGLTQLSLRENHQLTSFDGTGLSS